MDDPFHLFNMCFTGGGKAEAAGGASSRIVSDSHFPTFVAYSSGKFTKRLHFPFKKRHVFSGAYFSLRGRVNPAY